MKSIKTNPNFAKGPDKGKIVNKLYCILLTTFEYSIGVTRRRRFLKIDQSETRIAYGGHVCCWIGTK
jgi:hypothetical protein